MMKSPVQCECYAHAAQGFLLELTQSLKSFGLS